MVKTVIKQATTIEEQIERLKERGMIIRSDEFAKMYLWNIGYYRLGFYWFPYEQDYPQKVNRNHLFKEGTDFSTIMTLYDFDSTLRPMLSAALLKIEVDIRAKVIYLISNLHKQSPAWFADSRVVSRDFIEDFTEKYNREIINNEVIRNHARYHINDRFAPAWKTLEFLSFGDLQRLIASLKSDRDRMMIYNCYGFDEKKSFPNYIDVIRILRNYCAHGHPLFDFHFSRSIRAGKFKRVMKGKQIASNFYSSIQGALVLTQYFLYYLPENQGDIFRDRLRNYFSFIPSDIEPVVGFLKDTPWLEKKL